MRIRSQALKISHDGALDKFCSSLDLRSAYYQIPLLPEEKHYTIFEAGGKLFQFKRLPFGVTNGVSAFQRTIQNSPNAII